MRKLKTWLHPKSTCILLSYACYVAVYETNRLLDIAQNVAATAENIIEHLQKN